LDNTIENKIPSYFEEHQAISKKNLVKCILTDFPNLKESSINVYLSKLKKQGILKNPTRGVYALQAKPKFQPVIDPKLKRLYNKVKKNYPFVEFCVWNTLWLNDFMRHQPFKFYTIIEAEKNAAESIFQTLNTDGKQVFFEPDAETFDRYIANSSEVLIIKNLISESPLKMVNKVATPTLEKLLVDMTIDDKLYAAQQSEIRFIYDTSFNKYEVNKNKMKRYANRRNRESEVEKLTNITLANS
jgi:hypothetical protein